MSHRILLVDDEIDILEFVRYNLQKEGYEVFTAQNGAEALKAAAKYRPHLILLDMMMPVMDGAQTCRAIRQDPQLRDTMVVFLSALGEEDQQLTGFGVGADDYLTKPFRIAELRARVAAHLRREQRAPHARLRRGELEFDLAERAVYWQDTPLKLTKGEYAICEYLAMHPGQTFSKEQLYEAAFGYDSEADASAVTEHIKNIRAKLRALDCHPIDTVWGVGYRWKRDLP